MRDKRRGRKNPSDLQMRKLKANDQRSRKSQKLAPRAKQILSEMTKGDKMKEVVTLKQEPIIAYGLIEKISNEVRERIDALSIETLEPSEHALGEIKKLRAELNKDFEIFESQRKVVKDIVLRDYNVFESQYKAKIADQFKSADSKLKELVASVESKLLDEKIDRLKEFFNEVNKFDFVTFEKLNLKVTRSMKDNDLRDQIQSSLDRISSDVDTISTMEHSDRILAKYQASLDLNSAISQTNIEIRREAEIVAKRETEAVKVETEQQRQVEEDEEIFECTFTVLATKKQLRWLKSALAEQKIKII